MLDNLLTSLRQQLDPSIDLLRRMVEINSYTLNRPGVAAVAKLTAETFADLGFHAEHVPSIDSRYGAHLILTRRGSSDRSIGMITHLDTVFSPEEETRNHFTWRREGSKIYGPGTIDIKGGTVMVHLVLSTLKQISPALFNAVTWHVCANSSEEILSTDFAEVCRDRFGPKPLAVLVFEPGGKHKGRPSVVVARKGRATFNIEVQGRGAHAGSRHERGANAIVQLAEIVQNISALTDYNKGLTVNIGTFHGGTVVNRVPHHASAEIEMRAFTTEAFNHGIAAINAFHGRSTVASADRSHRCIVTVELSSDTPPWQINETTNHLLRLWQEAAQTAGLELEGEQRGGVSDGNYFWDSYPTIDGLGPYGDHAHCSEQSADGTKEQEYVDVDSFVPRAATSVLAIQKLAG